MARTRGASQAFHRDDGELIDKEGKPLPTGLDQAAQHDATPKLIHMDDGEIVPPAPKQPPAAPVSISAASSYHCDLGTCRRDLDAYEMLHLVALAFGGFSIDMTPEQFALQKADVRRHFKRIV